MIDLSKLTDPYERKARVQPALLCVLPIVLATSVSFPELYTTLAAFGTLVVTFGAIQFIGQIARDKGKKLEPALFKKWGGTPSVTIFRHRDKRIAGPAKQKLHRKLESQSEISAPSAEFEQQNSAKADEIYKAWSDFLRVKSRDTDRFSLLFRENINYGYRRNVYGLKCWYGISCVLGLLIIIASSSTIFLLSDLQLAMVWVIGLFGLYIIIVVTEKWVKVPGFEYSQRLVEVSEQLD